MTFILIRRKYVKLTVVVFLGAVVMLSLLSSYQVISKETLRKLNPNYFDKVYHQYFLNNDNVDQEFDGQVEGLLKGKKAADIENKYWLLETDHLSLMTLNIPNYYAASSGVEKPALQPFDPRFTLGMYVNHIKHSLSKKPNKVVEAPFHWDDWVDLSVLNVHLLAPDDQKPTCAILDDRDDEERLKKEKEAKEKEEKQELLEYEAKKTGGKAPEPAKEEEKKEKRLVKRQDAHDPKEFCVNNEDFPSYIKDGNSIRPGFNVFKPPGRITEDTAILIGKSYLYTYAPPPNQIIFLTKDGSYNVSYNGERKKLLNNNLVELYMKDSGKHSINVLDEFRTLQSTHPSNKQRVINDYEISLKPEDFDTDFNKVIAEYDDIIRTGKKLSSNELNYYKSLKYSRDKVAHGGPTKYFSEARLLQTTIGDHYDWRFFTGISYGTYEQTLTLHHLIRAFLSFCRKNGINTWVAHGSLLSWYWNGIAFPWDNDIDVQMPLNDLHKLSRDFNQTLIVEDLEDGLGRYFMDCGTFITLREKGNGFNNIDARFIDLDTGLYIDITGLASSNSKPPDRYRRNLPKNWEVDESNYKKTNEILQIYNCRNNHFSNLHELSPLIKSNIEGETGYIPSRFTDVLNVEYSRGILAKTFSDHIFLQQLRLWVKEEDLYYFLTDKDKWNNYHNYQENYIKDGVKHDLNGYELSDDEKKNLRLEAKLREKNGEKVDKSTYQAALNPDQLETILNFSQTELIELLKKDEILISYMSSKDFTSFHEKEIMSLLETKDTRTLIDSIDTFKPIKLDPFIFKIYNDYIKYDEEIDNYLNLIKIYKVSQMGNEPAE